jgi:hypothetical protein
MSMSDEEYFYTRAEAELKMAQAARHPNALRAHYTLAGHYLDRVYGGHEHSPASSDQIRAHLPISRYSQ